MEGPGRGRECWEQGWGRLGVAWEGCEGDW